MLTENLFEEVLLKPAGKGANKLLVVSGYATSAMALRQLEKTQERTGRKISIDLLIGMAVKDGISKVNHAGFQTLALHEYPGRFSCAYLHTPPPVHSKVYIWLTDDVPTHAFAGSANYSQTAFTSQREVLVTCDPFEGKAYFDDIAQHALDCGDPKSARFLNLYRPSIQTSFSAITSQSARLQGTSGVPNLNALPHVTVSFLARNGTLPQISGLNWGQRSGRERNQAYIPLPSTVYSTRFFPPVAEHFTVLTDDNKILHCTRAQQNGKAIHTYRSNSELGRYFRKRLRLIPGVAVQKSDLMNYGRHDVTFYKIDDENYFMDFS